MTRIDDDGRAYYHGTYSGTSLSYLKAYIETYWGGTVTRIDNSRESIIDALQLGPLLANVHVCGSSGGHYLVIHNVDDNDTPNNTADDRIIVNDPEPNCAIYSQTRTGENKSILATSFIGNWVQNGIYRVCFAGYSDLSKQFSFLVDTAHSVNDGYYNDNQDRSSKYTIYNYEELTDELSDEDTHREAMIHRLVVEDESMQDVYYYYGQGKDVIYLNPDNTNDNEEISSVKWKPCLPTRGLYRINYVYHDYGNIATVEFKLIDSSGQTVDTKAVSYANSKKVESKVLWQSIELETGYYVEVNDFRKDVNIDAMRFTYLGDHSEASWFFNNDNTEGWMLENCGNERISEEGWLKLQPSADPQLISPCLSIEPGDVDYLQLYGRNNSYDSSGSIRIISNRIDRYNNSNRITFFFPNDNRWHLIQIHVHDIPGWDAADKIHGIRIDPVENGDVTYDEILVDYIRLRKEITNHSESEVLQHPDGALITTASSPYDPDRQEIYLVENGSLRRIDSVAKLKHFNFDLCNIITVTQEEMSCYETGERVEIGPGSLIKTEDAAPVYLLSEPDCVRWIKSENVFHDYGFKLDEISHVEDIGESKSAPLTTIYPEGTLLKFRDSPTVFIVSKGMLSKIEDAVTFSYLGYSTEDIDDDGLWDSIVEVKSHLYGEVGLNVGMSTITKCSDPGTFTLELKWPLGGEDLRGGTKRLIEYVIDLPDQVMKDASVLIGYTTDAFNNFVTITDRGPTQSSWWWDVPDVDADKALIEVVAYDKDGRPYSAVPETFLTIEKGCNEGEDSFTIFNDGGEALEVNSIYLENSSAWVNLPNLPSFPFTIPPNSSVCVTVLVDRTGLSIGDHVDTIHVTSDDPEDPESTIEVRLRVNSEYVAPSPPINLNASPVSWSKSETFTLDWTNPPDPSGIVGGYYKLGSSPINNSDGIYFDEADKPLEIHAFSSGTCDVHIWLKDGEENIDFQNSSVVTIYHDTESPQVLQISPLANQSNVPVHTAVSCLARDGFSGINTGNIVITVDGVPVIAQEITSVGENVWIEYQPESNFAFDSFVAVYVKISDNSDSANFVERTYSFKTFSADGDADGDGLSNAEEYLSGTEPLNSDTDFDGMIDGWEVEQGLSPTSGEGDDGANGDIDGDGLTNLQEYLDGIYYSADPAQILDAPTGTVTDDTVTIHVGGAGVVAYQYLLDDGIWQSEGACDTPITLTGLSDGPHALYVIGKDQNGYWQSEGSATTASWTVSARPRKAMPWLTLLLLDESDTDGDGLSDSLESKTCTDPNDSDSDDDGIVDGAEDANHNGAVDPDETDPCEIDTDDDGIQDGTECGCTMDDVGPDTNTSVFQPDLDPTTSTDPLIRDTDKDGRLDGEEDVNHNGVVDLDETDPCDEDTDDDRMPDGWEVANGLDPLVDDAREDPDKDGAKNLLEYRKGTDPHDPDSRPPRAMPWLTLLLLDDSDTDDDGLPDSLESKTCTDPKDADTDDDGIPDGVEDANHNGVPDPDETHPCKIDTDGDGIQDGTECGCTMDDVGPDTNTTVFQPDLDPTTSTDPLIRDTDKDGRLDGEEDVNHNGRVDGGETDPNVHDG
ncbi:MAG: hypothetical protein SWE60_01955 [Thermodesulfobacteriota bacterium]|nr:hypothetical protein [Thermodesulfobacteriota bacterium]